MHWADQDLFELLAQRHAGLRRRRSHQCFAARRKDAGLARDKLPAHGRELEDALVEVDQRRVATGRREDRLRPLAAGGALLLGARQVGQQVDQRAREVALVTRLTRWPVLALHHPPAIAPTLPPTTGRPVAMASSTERQAPLLPSASQTITSSAR